MKIEAVQKDRDAWKIRPSDIENDHSAKHIKPLLRAENVYKEMRKAVHGVADPSELKMCPTLATKTDLADAIKKELLLLVEWVKIIPVFADLEMPDQVALLRSYASKFMIIRLALESLGESDSLVLPNGTLILREHLISPGFKVDSATDASAVNLNIFERVMDEIVEPLRSLCMDEMETVWFKAIILFNPYIGGVSAKALLKDMRNQLISEFERYISNKFLTSNGRLAHIMLLASSIEVVAEMAHESLRVCSHCGLILEDQLMHELLFSSSSETEVISRYAIPLQNIQNPIIRKLELTVQQFHSVQINGDPITTTANHQPRTIEEVPMNHSQTMPNLQSVDPGLTPHLPSTLVPSDPWHQQHQVVAGIGSGSSSPTEYPHIGPSARSTPPGHPHGDLSASRPGSPSPPTATSSEASSCSPPMEHLETDQQIRQQMFSATPLQPQRSAFSIPNNVYRHRYDQSLI
jgi:hypothetical protein